MSSIFRAVLSKLGCALPEPNHTLLPKAKPNHTLPDHQQNNYTEPKPTSEPLHESQIVLRPRYNNMVIHTERRPLSSPGTELTLVHLQSSSTRAQLRAFIQPRLLADRWILYNIPTDYELCDRVIERLCLGLGRASMLNELRLQPPPHGSLPAMVDFVEWLYEEVDGAHQLVQDNNGRLVYNLGDDDE